MPIASVIFNGKQSVWLKIRKRRLVRLHDGLVPKTECSQPLILVMHVFSYEYRRKSQWKDMCSIVEPNKFYSLENCLCSNYGILQLNPNLSSLMSLHVGPSACTLNRIVCMSGKPDTQVLTRPC
ncbi:unnamed protein product [Chondrus crispus]|uniref:Uncharacterized protein n=1 Tax=Chondrus crispus TaxID=2769 RepID=R7QM69_CHOCR|nr:unnamed protein product [Chondrus crispus]CDF38873.1 unnamed protein product [Chondrus crispus]|eukprot:XP_005718778.1 unnamed protein product [Chondrus crispus]